ncbi:MAG: hypothetical protein NVS3B26_28670 [Mycobacteriales bacterium]
MRPTAPQRDRVRIDGLPGLPRLAVSGRATGTVTVTWTLPRTQACCRWLPSIVKPAFSYA